MVDFAGWEMPVRYRGILREHRAVREAVGLFDVSHMGQIGVNGPAALAFCQRVLTNDVTRIEPFQAQYTLLLNESGGIVDDLIVYRLAAQRFLLCVNASRTAADIAWLASQSMDGSTIEDLTDAYALLALQGPFACKVLQRMTDLDLATLKRFHFVCGSVAGVSCLVARTGYTGEDGFELYCEGAKGPVLWDALLIGGDSIQVEPVGLGARDTLRLEQGFPLYGHELDEQTTPLEAGLGWIAKFAKGPFVGRAALLRQQATGISRTLVGLEMIGSGIARAGDTIAADGTLVGTVTSGTLSPTLGKAIALGYVSIEHSDPGRALYIMIRGRKREARVVGVPFV